MPYLNGGCHMVIPDRLIAGAFLMAAGITGGRVTVGEVIPEHLRMPGQAGGMRDGAGSGRDEHYRLRARFD